MSAADIAAPGGDKAFLNAPGLPDTDTGTEGGSDSGDPSASAPEAAKEGAAAEDINLAALEDGQPEWLGKIADPAVKGEVEKLLAIQKAFSERFKDAEDLNSFFKELPGGREQVTALQTLSKEIAELDGAIETNTPESNAQVAERYLSQAPDGGIGLFRASAHQLAKASPEAWNQISAELVNSTLANAGIGTDLAGVLGAIEEMHAAVAADDGEAFGKAAGKLLGKPKAGGTGKADPKLESLTQREQAAKAEATKAQQENYSFRREKSNDKILTHLSTKANELIAKAVTVSVPQTELAKLQSDVVGEVIQQVLSNDWLNAQIEQLIGVSSGHGGPKGPDYTKANLKAGQVEFDKASQMVMEAANPKLVAAAVKKIVSAWATQRASGNKDARDKARSAATRADVGAGGAPAAPKTIDATQLRARRPDGSYVVSDRDILNM